MINNDFYKTPFIKHLEKAYISTPSFEKDKKDYLMKPSP